MLALRFASAGINLIKLIDHMRSKCGWTKYGSPRLYGNREIDKITKI